jgi:1,4-alpha-glucan branching enzyme
MTERYAAFAAGQDYRLAGLLGARPSATGTDFAVWAPHARDAAVVGDFNQWDQTAHKMALAEDGVWQLFIAGLGPGTRYQYAITGADGATVLKADPMARAAELPPATASIISAAIPAVARRQPDRLDAPLTIYELHAPSWRRHDDGRPFSWPELADSLIPHVVALGFTHIELMPVMAHPFGGSWGYQVLGQFAPLPALGTPEEFAGFVAACHEAGLGVILDWVPGHFPADAHGMANFDGTALYEPPDPVQARHPDWGTLLYDFAKPQVRAFLISSALFWLETFGVDGLRVDAVSSMLYLDFSREPGAWRPNRHGGRQNLDAIGFLQALSRAITARCPGVLLIAEEATIWPRVSRPPNQGGLGFSHKWNMGWMHDTLDFIAADQPGRRGLHGRIGFGLTYAFSENFVLAISHDEVVHLKRSLFGRMPGDGPARFANLRAYLGFMWAHPGKKLLFMGAELAQPTEWDHDGQLPWALLDQPANRGIAATLTALNAVLRATPALYEQDFVPAGFAWVAGADEQRPVFAFLRFALDGAPVLAVCNFADARIDTEAFGVPGGIWEEVFNSDATVFGGGGTANQGPLHAEPAPRHGQSHSIRLSLAPLSTIILRRLPL